MAENKEHKRTVLKFEFNLDFLTAITFLQSMAFTGLLANLIWPESVFGCMSPVFMGAISFTGVVFLAADVLV